MKNFFDTVLKVLLNCSGKWFENIKITSKRQHKTNKINIILLMEN